MEIEAGTRLELRPVPIVRTSPGLPANDRGQYLSGPTNADPQGREDARRKRREKCLGMVGTLCRSLAREAERGKTARAQPSRQQSPALTRGQRAPSFDGKPANGPLESFANETGLIQNLIAEALTIEYSLDAMQILNAVRHSMRRPGSRCANLKHTTVDLHVEGEDVTADVSKYLRVDQDRPECRRVFGPNFSLIGTGKAVDRINGMMTDDWLVSRVRVLRQHSP